MAAPLFTLVVGDGLGAHIGADEEFFENATAILTPSIRDGDVVPVDGKLRTVPAVTVVLDADGKINGDSGVDLLADDPSLGLDNPLQWTVSFKRARAQGFARHVKEWTITAGTDGSTVDLAEVPPVVGVAAVGTRGPRTVLVPVDPEDPDTLYQWKDEYGNDVGPQITVDSVITTPVAEAAATAAANTVTPGIAETYWSSQAPGLVAGDTPGTVRQVFGGVESEEFPAAPGLVDGLADAGTAGKALAKAETVDTAQRAIGVIEYYDVRRSGAVCNGVTDDTAAWADAVATVSAAGGGKIWWRGVSVVSQIELSSKVGLLGLGTEVSALKQKAGRAAGQHLILLDELNAYAVSLQDFRINGNGAAQSGEAAGIYFDNAGGNILARHVIKNVYVYSVRGTGVRWGYGMRASIIDGLNIYSCDKYGFHGESFSDNMIQSMEVAQSGEHGIYLQGCYNNKFSNLKSWYSGRLVAGSNGVYQRNGNTNVYSNIGTQENSGSGMVLWGSDSPINGVIVKGFNSDSDNTAAGSNYGMSLNNVHDSIFDVTVTSEAPAASTLNTGVTMSNSTGNKITANIDPTVVTWVLNGAAIGDNDIDLCRGTTAVTPGTTTWQPSVYAHRVSRVTLTGNRTVLNPSTPSAGPPVGLTHRFVFIQDATGGRVLTWSSSYKLPAGTTFDTTANTRTVIEFECVAYQNWVMTKFVTGIPA